MQVALKYKRDWQKLSVEGNASYLRYRTTPESSFGNNYLNIGLTNQSYFFQASDDLLLEALFTYRPNNSWDILLGGTFKQVSSYPQTNDLPEPFDPDDYVPFTEERPDPDPILGDFGNNPLEYNISSAFLQGFYHKKRWSLLLGVRFIKSSQFELASSDSVDNIGAVALSDFTNQFLPRIGFMYKLSEKSSIRTSISTGFRLPPPQQTFGSLGLPGIDNNGNFTADSINYQLIPNPSLAPEITNNVELGYRYFISDKIYADATLFASATFNRINSNFSLVDTRVFPRAQVNYVEDDGSFSKRARQWVSVGNSASGLFGLQLMLRMEDVVPKYEVGVDAFLQIASGAENLPSGENLVGYRATPNRLFQLNISGKPTKKMYIRLESVWSSSWLRRNIVNLRALELPFARTDGYFVLDGTVRHQINKQLQAYIRVTNIFDTAYGGIGADGQDVDALINPQLGRNIQIGITFQK